MSRTVWGNVTPALAALKDNLEEREATLEEATEERDQASAAYWKLYGELNPPQREKYDAPLHNAALSRSIRDWATANSMFARWVEKQP